MTLGERTPANSQWEHRPLSSGKESVGRCWDCGWRIAVPVVALLVLAFGSPPAQAQDSDLAIEATAAPNDLPAGGEIIYTITVTNQGPSDAPDVQVVVTLSDSVAYLADNAFGVYDAGPPQTVTCDLGDLAVGVSTSFWLKSFVPADFLIGKPGVEEIGAATLNINAVVSSANTDPDSSDDLAYGSAFVQDEADLVVTKIGLPGEVQAGEEFTYTIFVDNFGPSYARGVYIEDDILSSGEFEIVEIVEDVFRNDEVTSIVADPPESAMIRGDLREALEPFGFGGNHTGRWQVRITLTAMEAQAVTNVVRAYTAANSDAPVQWESGTPDPDTSNNIAVASVDVSAVADIRFWTSGITGHDDDPDPVIAGELLDYSIRVHNDGPSTATNVRVFENLPAGVQIVDITSSSGDCNYGTPGDPLDPTWCILDELDEGESHTVHIFVRVPPDMPFNPLVPCTAPPPYCAGRMFADAYFVSDQFDPDLSNNLQGESTDVHFEADLQVFNSDNPDTVRAGEALTYEVVVDNAGSSTARDVGLLDNLPDEVTFISASLFQDPDVQCVYLEASHQVLCELGDLEPGTPPLGQRNILIEVLVNPDVPAGTIMTNSAQVFTFQTYDPDDGNNTETEETTVLSQAVLTVEKTASALNPKAGSDLTYTITVTNNGPSDALNVEVIDLLPAGVHYVADSDACVEGPAGTLTCRPAGLEPDYVLSAGESVSFDVQVEVDATAECNAQIENSVSVTADNAETVFDSAIVRIGCAADLRITKFGKPDREVQAGEVLEYTVIVDNLGPGMAEDVAVFDLLQSSGRFDLIDVISDRDAICGGIPGPPAATALPAAPWPPADPPPAFGVDPTTGVAGIDRRLELNCILNDPLLPLAADGPPNTGRWIITVRVRAAEQQTINNVADVLCTSDELDYSNNHAEVENAITEAADIAITKTADPVEVFAGDSLTYTLSITNNGASTATNVVVEDALPAGLTITDVSTSQGTPIQGTPGDPAAPTTVILGEMAAGATAAIAIVVSTTETTTIGPLTNTASAHADQFDPIVGNNVAQITTTIQPPEPAAQETPPAGSPFEVFLPVAPLLPFPACGISLCGGGMVSMMPVLMLTYWSLRSAHRRRGRRRRGR